LRSIYEVNLSLCDVAISQPIPYCTIKLEVSDGSSPPPPQLSSRLFLPKRNWVQRPDLLDKLGDRLLELQSPSFAETHSIYPALKSGALQGSACCPSAPRCGHCRRCSGSSRWWRAGRNSRLILDFWLRANRAFCKYVCPITTILKYVTRFSLLKIRGESELAWISCIRPHSIPCTSHPPAPYSARDQVL